MSAVALFLHLYTFGSAYNTFQKGQDLRDRPRSLSFVIFSHTLVAIHQVSSQAIAFFSRLSMLMRQHFFVVNDPIDQLS